MATLSLCMIVKDEEANITRCLDSVSSFVDEIIILDTGSSDQTKELCEQYSATILDYEWDNDFSKARNSCIEKASCDWIFWLDADEQLILDKESNFKDRLSDNKNCIYAVQMFHLYGEGTIEEKEYYMSYGLRLFPNKNGLHFEGLIHERLIFEEDSHSIELFPSIHLVHYGYQNNILLAKAMQNLKLLVLQKGSAEDNPWVDYHIAAELFRLNHSDKAFLFVNQSISNFLTEGIVPPALIYKLKYEILIYSNSLENAYNGIEKAIELYPDYVELHFYKGLLLLKKKHYLDAIHVFEYCIILGEEHLDYLITAGTGSFLAYECIGDCYTGLNQQTNARSSYHQALLIYPDFKRVEEKLVNLTSQTFN